MLSLSGRGAIAMSVSAKAALAPIMSVMAPTKIFELLVLIPFFINLIPCELIDLWQNLLGMEIRPDEVEESGRKSQYFS